MLNGTDIVSENGLTDLVLEEVGDGRVPRFTIAPLQPRNRLRPYSSASTKPSSFVNGQFTSDGGTYLSAFREGFLKGVNEFAKACFDGDDVRESM